MEQEEIIRQVRRLEQQIHTLAQLFGVEELEVAGQSEEKKSLSIASSGGGLLGLLNGLIDVLDRLLDTIAGS